MRGQFVPSFITENYGCSRRGISGLPRENLRLWNGMF